MSLGYLFHRILRINKDINDDNYELSRRNFIVEGCTANTIFALTSGAFFVGYAKYLGASDQFNGILISLPLISNVIQMFSPLILERLASRKKLLIALLVFFRMLLAMMILVPIITDNKSARLLMLGGMYFTAYLAAGFSAPGTGSWIISLVPERMRGRYFGLRDMFLLASSATTSIIMGRVLDIFKSRSQEFIGFIIVFTVVFLLAIFNFIVLRKIKEPSFVRLEQKLSLKSVLTMPLKNEKFRQIILLFVLWNFTAQLSIPFFSVYMVTGLKLSYTFIMAMGIILTSFQALSARMIWGKVADKRGWEFATVISISMIGLCHLTWIFVNSSTYFILIPIIQIVAGAAWAGVNLSLFNIQFQYAPQEGRTIFIGFNAALAGMAGFTSALIGAALVGALNGIKINIGITTLDNMLLIFGISGLLIVACAIYFSYQFKKK